MLKQLEAEVGAFCFGLWDRPTDGGLLLLVGNNGTAKTHCAKAVRDWCRKVGHGKQYIKPGAPGVIRHLDLIFWSWPRLLDHLKAGVWEAVDDMLEATLLIIDDLGAGYDPSGIGTDKLCQVLSKRERMWTLITTNVMQASWEHSFDRRVASRFIRNSTVVDLSEVPDYYAV